MAKLVEYEFRKLGQQVVDFGDDIRDVINNGKVAHSIVTSVPAWTADNGEMAFYSSLQGTTDRRIYVRLDSSWVVFAQLLGTGSGPGAVPGGPEAAVQYNSGGTFGGVSTFLFSQTGPTLMVGGRYIAGSSLSLLSANLNSFPRFYFVDTGGGGSGANILGVALQPYGTNSGMFFITPGRLGIGPDNPQAELHIKDPGRQVIELMEGDPTQGYPCLLKMGYADTVNTVGQMRAAGAPVGVSAVNRFSFDVSSSPQNQGNNKTYISWLNLFNAAPHETNLNQEDPEVVFGNIVATNTFTVSGAGQVLTFTSGLTLATQRQFIFASPSYGATSNSTITDASTVFIQGAPVSTGSMSVTNRYALWVGSGNVRIDGQVITGAATTPARGSTFFTTTAIGVSSNNSADTTLIRGIIGTTSLVANTLSEGRTIRLQAFGYYNTPSVADNLTMNVKLGGTTVLTTGAQTPASSVSTGGWHLNALITCLTTGGAGTIMSQGEFPHQSTAILEVNWQMVNSSNVTVNTTGANVVEITAQWGGASAASQIFLTNAVGELLN